VNDKEEMSTAALCVVCHMRHW